MSRSLIQENEVPLNNERYLGRLTLDNPTALNALNLDMIEAIQAALDRWEQRSDIVAIVIDAASDKAFCAGGDIVNLRRAIIGEIDADYPLRFFAAEYRLCHDLRRMQTPVVAWGHGIVMGGGCGLFTAAAHRVVTGTTRLAMPEIKIGLFPDCAATWFFNRLPLYLARFIALTGATLNSADVLFAGLAEHAIRQTAKDDFMTCLADVTDWHAPHRTVAECLRAVASEAPAARASDSRLAHHADTLHAATAGAALVDIVERLTALAAHDDPWLAEAGQNLVAGCPMTAHLVHRQLEDGRYLSLAQCVQRELAMALQCCAHADFAEGVRALLVDKDRQPRWQHASVAEVSAATVDRHFTATWAGDHPLGDLAEIPAVDTEAPISAPSATPRR